MALISKDIQDLPQVAKALIDAGNESKRIAFRGNLGAGKTTLVGNILKEFGIHEFNGSPTFSLVNEYQSPDGRAIYHFDFYRITDIEEALDIGWDEYLADTEAWILIEWPERIEALLPEHFLLVEIQLENGIRTFQQKLF